MPSIVESINTETSVEELRSLGDFFEEDNSGLKHCSDSCMTVADSKLLHCIHQTGKQHGTGGSLKPIKEFQVFT